jgi:hypothetical protein
MWGMAICTGKSDCFIFYKRLVAFVKLATTYLLAIESEGRFAWKRTSEYYA